MPDILTTDVQPQYLTDEAFNADELELIVDRAERKVVDRYREIDARSDDLVRDVHYDADVRLDGWAETDEGDPDVDAMDDGLLDALRTTIALVVEHVADKPDEHVSRLRQGERTVEFRDKDLPSNVYRPLDRFDARTPFAFGL